MWALLLALGAAAAADKPYTLTMPREYHVDCMDATAQFRLQSKSTDPDPVPWNVTVRVRRDVVFTARDICMTARSYIVRNDERAHHVAFTLSCQDEFVGAKGCACPHMKVTIMTNADDVIQTAELRLAQEDVRFTFYFATPPPSQAVPGVFDFTSRSTLPCCRDAPPNDEKICTEQSFPSHTPTIQIPSRTPSRTPAISPVTVGPSTSPSNRPGMADGEERDEL